MDDLSSAQHDREKQEFRDLRDKLGKIIQILREISTKTTALKDGSFDVETVTKQIQEAQLLRIYNVEEGEEGAEEIVLGKEMDAISLRDQLLTYVFRPLLSRLFTLAQKLTHASGHIQRPAGHAQGPPPSGMFSMADFNHLRTMLELLVLWNLYPYLEEGVGVALERRPESKAVLISRSILAWSMVITTERTLMKVQDLLSCGEILQQAMELEQFSSVFQVRYIADVLALYLQLLHQQQQQQQQEEEEEAAMALVEEKMEGLKARISPRVMILGLRALLGAGKEVVPAWLRQEASQGLSQVLMHPGGLRAVLESFLGGLAVGEDEESMKAPLKVAQLLACVPQWTTADAYIQALAPQFPPLLHTPARDQELVQRLLALVIGRLTQRMPQPMWKHLLSSRLFRPLLLFQEQEEQEEEDEEKSISQALQDLHILLHGAPPLPVVIDLLLKARIDISLLQLYALTTQGGQQLRGSREIEECLGTLLQHGEGGKLVVANLVEGYLMLCGVSSSGRGRRRPPLMYRAGPTGGIVRGRKDDDDDGEEAGPRQTTKILLVSEEEGGSDDWEKLLTSQIPEAVQIVLELMKSLLGEDTTLPGKLLERLLLMYLELKGALATPEKIDLLKKQSYWAESIEDLQTTRAQQQEEHHPVVDNHLQLEAPALMMLLEGLVGLAPTQILRSGEQIIRCCALVLLLGTAAEEEEGSSVKELASIVLGLLAVLLEMGAEERVEHEEKALKELLPLLESFLHQKLQTDGLQLREMALTVHSMILTRSLTVEEREEEQRREEAAVRAREQGGESALDAVLQVIQEDLHSPLAPLRARGVVSLTKVLHRLPRRPLVEEETEGGGSGKAALLGQVLEVLLELLDDEESFVYLAAVQGLAVLSNKASSLVIKRLVQELKNGKGKKESMQFQYKLKVGEALVQALQRCGEAMPVYAPLVFPALIKGSQRSLKKKEEEEEETLYRASCLSALAEVGELLGWTVGRFVDDLLDLALGILKNPETETAKEVRRAAAFLVKKVLQGLGPQRLTGTVLSWAQLSAIQNVLKKVLEGEKDDVCRIHAQRALQVIEDGFLQQVEEHLDPRQSQMKALEELTTRLLGTNQHI